MCTLFEKVLRSDLRLVDFHFVYIFSKMIKSVIYKKKKFNHKCLLVIND